MQEAKFYKKLPDKTAACELCCHYCIIKEGAAGICGARKNLNGTLYSLVYGYPAAINIDPIEKKPLFHFLPGSSTFSLGTLGCNFKCSNCQNWEISQIPPSPLRQRRINLSREKIQPSLTPLFKKGNAIVEPQKIVQQAVESGCRSIAYTYNEPTIFAEYALDIMKPAKQNNLKNVWVSNGYMSDSCLEALIPYLDAINVDVKSMDEKFYKKTCGAKLEPVLQNLLNIKKAGIHLEITTLIIPKLSDDPAMLKELAEFIAQKLGPETPWHLSKFSPEVSWKLKRSSATAEKVVLAGCEIGKRAGLKYVYAGNLYNSDKENTYCPKCGQLAIKRLGYDITEYDNDGKCQKCHLDLNIIT